MDEKSLESLRKFADAMAMATMERLIPAAHYAVSALHDAERVYATLRALGADDGQIDRNIGMVKPSVKTVAELGRMMSNGEAIRLVEDATEYLRRLEYTRRLYAHDGKLPIE